MSGNICRCGAYPNIVAAIEQVMARRSETGDESLLLRRGRRRGRARPREVAAEPEAKFIAGGTNLVDLMKDDVERPTPADRHHAAAPARDRRRPRPAACGSARW